MQHLNAEVLAHIINLNLFYSLRNHMFDHSILDNHFVLLLKSICKILLQAELNLKQKN